MLKKISFRLSRSKLNINSLNNEKILVRLSHSWYVLLDENAVRSDYHFIFTKTHMKKVLHIISSASWDYSTSTSLAKNALGMIDAEVVTLDLSKTHMPFVTWGVSMNLYWMLSDDQMSESDASIKALRNELVDQLLSVDTVVVSVPVWNYGVPASLKAYIDLIGVMGRTWKIENHQYIGLATNVKNTVVVMSAGGMWYVDGAMQEYNFVSPYLEKVLSSFMWMQNYKLFAVEWTNMDKDSIPARVTATQEALNEYIKSI